MNFKLETLKKQMINCQSCDLCKTRSQVVFDNNVTKANVMIIGEGPGEEEDKQGVPFVGKAGQKLDKILDFVGLKREEVYITNAILCRPPNNRVPRPEELDACRWRLNLQIEAIKPKLIIALGRTAVQQLKGEPIKGPLTQFFGDWHNYTIGEQNIKMLVTYHPSYLLRSPEKGYKETLPHWRKVKQWVEKQKTEAVCRTR